MSWSRFFRRRYWDEERAREIEHCIFEETAPIGYSEASIERFKATRCLSIWISTGACCCLPPGWRC